MIALEPAMVILFFSAALPCPPAKEEPIQVIILVILATDQNDQVNERIKEIAVEVRKKDDKLTGFALHRTIRKSIKMGESANIELCKKNSMEVTINEKPDNEGRVTLSIKPPKLAEITYACTCGKFFPIITNCYTEDKQRLIIAIMARPCKKK